MMRDIPSKDVRLGHRGAEARFEEVEVAALVRLANVADTRPADRGC
jgi:hypothetical protein